MATVTLQVDVKREQVNELQKDIEKLNKTTITIQTSRTTKDITATETATRQLLRTEKERQRLEQETQKTAQQTAKAERDRQNAIAATEKAERAKINTERAAAKQAQETARAEQQAAKADREADKATKEHNKNLKQQGLLYDILGRSVTSFIARMTAYRAVYAGIRAITNGMKEALQTMKQVDDQLVSVRKVTGFDDATLKLIEQNAYKTASQYGTTAPEYMESVVRFSQAGYKNLSSDLAELSTKTQIVGDLTGEVADQFLLSVDAAYKYNGSITELSKVLDGLNEIENNNATSIEKMAEGMGIVAPVAAQMHVSVDELAASLGTITAVTQRSGTEAARALRAIYLNIVGDTKTEIEEGVTWTTGEIEGLRDVIKLYAKDAWDAAQASGGIIDPMKAIAGLAKSVKDGVLSEAQLMEMVSDIGGKLRTSQLLALINNWDMYETMLAQYRDAFGSADKEVENAMDSWTRKSNVLKNTWTEFVQKSLNSELFKKFLDILTHVVKHLGSLEGSLFRLAPLVAAIKLREMAKALKDTTTQATGLAGALQKVGVSASALNKASVILAAIAIAWQAISAAIEDAEIKHQKEVDTIYENADAAQESSNNIYDLYKNMVSATEGSNDFEAAVTSLADALGKDLPEGVKKSQDALREYTAQQLLSYASTVNAAKTTAESEFVKKSDESAGIELRAFDNPAYEIFYDYSEELYDKIAEINRKIPLREGLDIFNIENINDAQKFRDVMQEVVDAVQEYARVSGDTSVFDVEYYKSALTYLGETKGEYDKLTSAISESAKAYAKYIYVAEGLEDANVNNRDSVMGLVRTLKDKYDLTQDEIDAVLALIRVTQEAADGEDEETKALQKNTDAQEANTKAKERATAAAKALVPVLFDESGKLTEVAEEALRTSSYLADLVQAEIDLQNETQRANYARMRAELAALAGEAVRTAKAIMAAYAMSASLSTLKVYAMDNGATPDVMKAITLLSALDSLEARINQTAAYSATITPYTSSYKPSSYSGSSGGSSSSRPSSSSSSSSTTKTEDVKLKALQNRLTLLKSELSLMQERGDSEADQIKKMKEIMKALHNEAEYLRSIGGDQATINNLSQEWWSYHNKIESIMEKEAEDAERQAKAIQDAVDAQLALNNALTQRSVRIYNASTGRWEWTANPTDVNSAREAYNNAMANLSPSDMGAYNAALAQAYANQTGLLASELYAQGLLGSNNSGGSTHNGNNYNFGNFTFSEAQAKGISLYDLAQLARSLAIYS